MLILCNTWVIASSIEVFLEIRHLQRTEVQKLKNFWKKQKDLNNAHKKNPILSENLTDSEINQIKHSLAKT